VRVWDAESAKLKATLLQPPASTAAAAIDWLIILPSGQVAASEPLEPLLRWQSAGKELPSADALRFYFKPDEVAEALRN
jgi:hypothetical protein